MDKGGCPYLDSEKLRGYIACSATAAEGACLDINMGTHMFDTTALTPMRVLFEAGMSREPVHDIQQWEQRVEMVQRELDASRRETVSVSGYNEVTRVTVRLEEEAATLRAEVFKLRVRM